MFDHAIVTSLPRALTPCRGSPPIAGVEEWTMARKARRKRYTKAEKRHILATAVKEGLTGAQVQKRFGIAQLTFYRWRGPVRGPRARARAAAGGTGARGNLDSIRAEVRAGIRQVLPDVIRQEVAAYLGEILGRTPGKRRGRKPGPKPGKKRGPGRPRKS